MRSIWESRLDVGLTRRDRAPCRYAAYLPDTLEDRAFVLDGLVAADVADAERAIQRLDREAGSLADTEAIARLLLRGEAVASSRIEGFEVGGRRLLRAEAAIALGEQVRDVTAAEVLANIDAMSWAVSTLSSDGEVTTESILDAHRLLLEHGPLRAHAGRLRTEQNWIGGSSFNPCKAEFVPPPPERVSQLMADLARFCNRDLLSPVTQAAIAHAQFETIHPFVDGNGRIGRILIHVLFRRRGLTTRVSPPVSLALATAASDYVAGLTATRYVGAPDERAAQDGMNRWIEVFAAACRRAVRDAEDFESSVNEIVARWRTVVGQVRRSSSVDLLLRALPGAPVVTVDAAANLIGRSFQRTNEAVARLVDAGVLTPLTVARRNRAFEAADVLHAFNRFERRLASPAGDTRLARPARAAPARPQPD